MPKSPRIATYIAAYIPKPRVTTDVTPARPLAPLARRPHAIPVAAQTAFVVLGNLAISFAWFGLPHQWPEALWQLDPGASGLRAQLAPLQRCPEPSY